MSIYSLSRSHPKFIAKLFEMEIPEIANGAVEIKTLPEKQDQDQKLPLFPNKTELIQLVRVSGKRVCA